MHPNIVILAGGISSRMKKAVPASASLDPTLRRDAEQKAKSMIGVGEDSRPFLDFLLYNIAQAGYHHVVIVIGEKDQSIREYYNDGKGAALLQSLHIQYAVQPIPAGRQKPLGTADALWHALKATPAWRGESFTVCNSDNLYSREALRLLREDTHNNALIDYDRAGLQFTPERILAFAAIKKDADGFLQDILEKPSPQEIADVADANGRIGVSMNIFRLSYDQILPCLEAVPLHPLRQEKELPAAVKMLVDQNPRAVFTIPRSEHVPDLTLQSDILPVKEYLRKEYQNFQTKENLMNTSRRDFLKTAAIAGVGISILPSRVVFADTKTPKVRLGFIGVGLRGQDHLDLALRRDDVEVVAICDIQQVMIDASLEIIKKSGKPLPRVIKEGPYDYRKLLEMNEIDGVIISTPWEWHSVMSLDAMNAKKYVGCEVIAGSTVEECWDLVNTSERTGMPLMMLENVCYRRDVMAILNMVRQGLFGELVHLQAGYQHDLREVKFNNGKQPYGGGVEFGEKGFSEAQWRTQHSITRNGDLYPTHGIGPAAMMIDINRGNRFVSLVSYASKTRGLHEHIVKHGGENHPNAKIKFKLGDVVTTMIKTNNDETILLQHDTSLPRPYSLGFRVQGTRGLWMDVNRSLYIEGVSKEPHRWEDAKPYLEQYDHPLWKRFGNDAKGAGHGGMDFFVLHAFIESLKRKVNTPLDVYDAVAWSAITPLSEASIQLGGETVEFPDFTRGKWMYRKNTFALDEQY